MYVPPPAGGGLTGVSVRGRYPRFFCESNKIQDFFVNPIKANKSQDFFVNFYWLLLVSESITKKVRIIFFHFVAVVR
jgi:hypothetical protein